MKKKINQADKKSQEEFREKVKAFLDDYIILVKKHMMDFGARLSYHPEGLMPKVYVKEVKEAPKLKKSEDTQQ